MEEREREMCFGQEEEEGVVLCEIEEEWRGLYSEGRGVRFVHLGWV